MHYWHARLHWACPRIPPHLLPAFPCLLRPTCSACHFREIDFELARWGNEGDTNAGQWVVQPWTVPGNLKRFNINKAKSFGGQHGPKGGGNCADPGPEGFGGAQWQQLTLLMQWFPGGLLRFYVFDGHHNLGNIVQVSAAMHAGSVLLLYLPLLSTQACID